MLYPNQLLKEIKLIWPKFRFHKEEKIGELPSDKILLELLETVYHASFLTEESRKIGVRVLYAQYETIKKDFDEPHAEGKKTLIKFDRYRLFSKSEILRLAPATDLEKMLIGVMSDEEGNLKIWGLIDIGSNWWKYIHGQANSGLIPPNYLTVSSTTPGNLTISRSGHIILNLSGGKINRPLSDVFENGPIYEFFNESHNTFYNEVCAELKVKKFDKYDDHIPILNYIKFITKLIFNIRNLHHGGTLIIIPDKITSKDVRLTDRINIKYISDFNEPWETLKKYIVSWRNYYNSYAALAHGRKLIGKKDFREVHQLELKMENIEEHIDDIAKLLASLSGIDGAVVITDRYRLLGFGGEVIVHSPNLTHISVAEDIEGKKVYEIPIESYGTRHRSAFRFCSSYEDAIAIVISQDGGVRAVKRCGQKVVLWSDINEGHYGI
ncbi:MAG: putative sensor domain DACNV-containing protein [Bacteroidia bacterium]